MDNVVPESVTNTDDIVRKGNNNPLINRKGVRRFALDYCLRSQRCHVRNNMRRISDQVFVDLEAKMREWIRNRVDSQPSKGKTVM